MDYKKNNEALDIVKRMVADGQVSQDVAEKYFPELAESEDERIRKKVIDVLKINIRGAESQMQASRGVDRTFEVHACNKVIALLEKQGEQNPTNLAKGEDYGIDGLYNAIRILEKTLGKVEGYQTDDGILEHECAISAVKKLYEQKSAWSEEDERMMNDTLAVVDWYAGKHRNISVKVGNWLKLLKSRVLSLSMREFDKEEGSIIDHLIAICDDAMCYDTFAGCSKKDIEKYKTFLTNLKFGIEPQKKQWKPSDEQMKVLDVAIKSSHLTTAEYNGLVNLREQLKKL